MHFLKVQESGLPRIKDGRIDAKLAADDNVLNCSSGARTMPGNEDEGFNWMRLSFIGSMTWEALKICRTADPWAVVEKSLTASEKCECFLDFWMDESRQRAARTRWRIHW